MHEPQASLVFDARACVWELDINMNTTTISTGAEVLVIVVDFLCAIAVLLLQVHNFEHQDFYKK